MAPGWLERGSEIRVSEVGPPCDPTYIARLPSVAYNATNDDYLVVWSGNGTFIGMTIGEEEIFGRVLDGDGSPGFVLSFRYSEMGGSGDAAFAAREPDVAWNATENEYLVVWYGDHDVDGLIDG